MRKYILVNCLCCLIISSASVSVFAEVIDCKPTTEKDKSVELRLPILSENKLTDNYSSHNIGIKKVPNTELRNSVHLTKSVIDEWIASDPEIIVLPGKRAKQKGYYMKKAYRTDGKPIVYVGGCPLLEIDVVFKWPNKGKDEFFTTNEYLVTAFVTKELYLTNLQAFGLSIGDTLSESIVKEMKYEGQNERTGIKTYEVTPSIVNQYFDKYKVTTQPNNKIITISASGKCKQKQGSPMHALSECANNYRKIELALKAKYGEGKVLANSMKNNLIEFIEYQKYVKLAQRGLNLTLLYGDGNLEYGFNYQPPPKDIPDKKAGIGL